MRVLFVYAKADVGGVETWVATMARALTARGHATEGFFFRAGPLSERPPAGMTTHVGTLADLVELTAGGGYEIIHTASADYDYGCRLLHRTAGASRLVATGHGTCTAGWRSTTCAGLAVVSRWLRQWQEQVTDLPVRCILNGIDTERFRPGPGGPAAAGGPIVAWVGRSSDLECKRIDRFADLAIPLAARGYRIWVVDPEGPERVPEPWRGRLAGVAQRWAGATYDEMPELYRTIAASGGLVVCTSDSEGLGLSLLEAQACGCPLAGPAVRGVDEAVDPAYGGLLYPPDLPAGELAARLEAALADEAGLARRREQAVALARERFTLDRMVDEYLQFYADLPTPPVRPLPRPGEWGPLAPLTDWRGYVERRWSAGAALLAAARELAERGRGALAAVAAAEAAREAPTLLLRPTRYRAWRRLRRGRPA